MYRLSSRSGFHWHKPGGRTGSGAIAVQHGLVLQAEHSVSGCTQCSTSGTWTPFVGLVETLTSCTSIVTHSCTHTRTGALRTTVGFGSLEISLRLSSRLARDAFAAAGRVAG